jgi:hypothetical protein
MLRLVFVWCLVVQGVCGCMTLPSQPVPQRASLHRMSFFLGFQIDTLTPLLLGPPGSGHGSRRGRR